MNATRVVSSDADLLLRLLRLTGWTVEVCEDATGVTAFAERPSRTDADRIAVSVSGRSVAMVVAELFELACERMDAHKRAQVIPLAP